MYSPAIGWEEKLSKVLNDNFNLEKLQSRELVLSFSGGADSVLALYILLALKNNLLFPKLTLFYLNHGQYFSSTLSDQRSAIMNTHVEFARKILGNDKVSLVVVSRNVSKLAKKLKVSFERAGSLLRRRHLSRSASSSQPVFVTGHSLSDWLETVVLRLNRGASLDALIPLASYQSQGGMDFFYPVAHLSRREIRELLSEFNIPWWEDPTNQDLKIARNRIRSVLDFHPAGLRRARQNFLTNPIFKELKLSEQQLALHWKVIVPKREYHLPLNFFLQQNEEKRLSLLLTGLAAVGLTPVNRQVRAALLKKPQLHYGPWHLETENWQGNLVLVSRRGRSRLPNQFPLAENIVFASQLSSNAVIKLSYGHKKVKKIFSELKLSLRQRKALPVAMEPRNPNLVVKIYLEVFGLKNLVAVNSS